MKAYNLYRAWVRWLVPFPIWLWHMKRDFHSAVMYQDKDVTITMERVARCEHGVWKGDYCYKCEK